MDTNRSAHPPAPTYQPTCTHPTTHPLHVQQQTHCRSIHVSLLLFKCASTYVYVHMCVYVCVCTNVRVRMCMYICACTYVYVHVSFVRSVVEKSPTTIRLFVKRPWKENWHCKEREARPWVGLIESLPTCEGVTVHIRMSHGARMNASWLTRPPHGAVTGVCCSV